MYHSKKIAYFVSHIYGDYQMKLTSGIVSKSHEYGYPLEIYTTNDGENLGNYALGEESILKIPNFDDIAGVLFASGTYSDPALRDKITALLLSHKDIPVIEITETSPTFTAVSMDNNRAAGILTEHVINSHKAGKVCFLGTTKHKYHSDKRERAYREAINSSSLPENSEYVYLCDESDEDYKSALNFFLSDGKPDAVICYNDDIALDFMELAKKEGYEIPRDFIITGCDYTENGQNISPSLTTVEFPLDKVGAQAVSSLISLINGSSQDNVTICADPIYLESCGCTACSHSDSFMYLRNRTEKIDRLEKSMLLSMKMSTALSHSRDLDEGCDIISDFITQIDNLKEFYMCLYSDWNSLTDPALAFLKDYEDEKISGENVILKFGIKNNRRVPECSFKKVALLPEFVSPDDNKAFLVTPLFFENRAFGYLAMSFETGTINFPFYLVQWITNIAQFLQNIYDGELTSLMARQLEELYLNDPLTGLKNRHGFNKALSSIKGASSHYSIVMMDLDGLKKINDTYGHEEGDFALKTIGQALLSIAKESDICARFGGDEFYCLLPHDSEEYTDTFISRIQKYLSNYNNLSGKPYRINASIGYETVSSFSVEDITELIRSADQKMYEIKKNKK